MTVEQKRKAFDESLHAFAKTKSLHLHVNEDTPKFIHYEFSKKGFGKIGLGLEHEALIEAIENAEEDAIAETFRKVVNTEMEKRKNILKEVEANHHVPASLTGEFVWFLAAVEASTQGTQVDIQYSFEGDEILFDLSIKAKFEDHEGAFISNIATKSYNFFRDLEENPERCVNRFKDTIMKEMQEAIDRHEQGHTVH